MKIGSTKPPIVGPATKGAGTGKHHQEDRPGQTAPPSKSSQDTALSGPTGPQPMEPNAAATQAVGGQQQTAPPSQSSAGGGMKAGQFQLGKIKG